ncbi:hypothetical protein PENTCL1PPCAC_16235, partial [Pristionchus entomophagus]
KDDSLQPNTHEMMAIVAIFSVGGHTVVISMICFFKISKAFYNSAMEISARRMHIQLFRALLIQYTIPVVFSMVPTITIFALPATGISLGQLGNVFGLLVSTFPAVDPILIIVSIGRFRATLLEWIAVITGRKATRNEQKAKERTRVYAAVLRPRSTRT